MCSGGLVSWWSTPVLGSPIWGSDLSVLCEKLCNVIILLFVSWLSKGMELDCIVSLPFLPVLWFLLCVCSWNLFGRFWSFSSVVALWIVVTWVWLWGKAWSFYSAILVNCPNAAFWPQIFYSVRTLDQVFLRTSGQVLTLSKLLLHDKEKSELCESRITGPEGKKNPWNWEYHLLGMVPPASMPSPGGCGCNGHNQEQFSPRELVLQQTDSWTQQLL